MPNASAISTTVAFEAASLHGNIVNNSKCVFLTELSFGFHLVPPSGLGRLHMACCSRVTELDECKVGIVSELAESGK